MNVKLDFIGIEGKVLETIEFDSKVTSFDISLVNPEEWYLMHREKNKIVSKSVMESLCYVSGFESMPNLKRFFFTRFPPRINVLLPLEKWPDFDYIMEKSRTVELPSIMMPPHLSNWANGQQTATKFREYWASFSFACKKIVEISLSLSFLPNYIILWIADWLPNVFFQKEWKKMQLISAITKISKIK